MFFGFGYDPLYLLLTLIGLPLMFLPQWWVKSTYDKFRQQPAMRGLTGAQVARQMLADNGIHDVRVEETPGLLTDHYSPTEKVVRLSHDNYVGTSVAAATIAAHEVGHAIQHAKGYVPVVLRSQLAPVFGLGSQVGPLLFSAAIMLYFLMGVGGDLAFLLASAGVGLFGLSVLFHLVTLPVEIDASSRALKVLSGHHFLQAKEMPGAKKVLTAAAFTYVATALYSLLQLAYYIFYLTNMRRSEE